MVFGPGLIVMEADNDAGAVSTSVQFLLCRWLRPDCFRIHRERRGEKDMTVTTELDDMTVEEMTFFSIVHPVDDAPEKKVGTENLGSMQMTKTMRICLFALRGYLLLMFGLLGFRVLQLAGLVHP
jgi:hypothetical protein